MYVYIDIYRYIYTYTCIYIYIYMYMYVFVYIYLYILILYIYTYLHIYICIHYTLPDELRRNCTSWRLVSHTPTFNIFVCLACVACTLFLCATAYSLRCWFFVSFCYYDAIPSAATRTLRTAKELCCTLLALCIYSTYCPWNYDAPAPIDVR